MGIKGLMQFITQNAPTSVKESSFAALTGRKIAIDASMSLYQFLIAIQSGDSYGALTNADGEVTSHIAGILSRVVRMLEAGIKPVYVFDGKPPELKSGELLKRSERRREAETQLKEAIEAGNEEDIKKFTSRTVRVTSQHNDDVKELLDLLGVPWVQALHDAESQCAVMAQRGDVFGVGTEDLDALTFGASFMLRHLNVSEAKSKTHPVLQIELASVLASSDLTREQFVEFCILCGCDFTDTIRGIGPVSAFKLIKQHGSMEKVLEQLPEEKYPRPSHFDWKAAKQYFMDPPCIPTPALELKPVQEDGLKSFLVERHGFSELRVSNAIEKIKKSKQKTAQTRLESFFGPVKTTLSEKKLAEEKVKRETEKALKNKAASDKRKAAQAVAALHKQRLNEANAESAAKIAEARRAANLPETSSPVKKESALEWPIKTVKVEVKEEPKSKRSRIPAAEMSSSSESDDLLVDDDEDDDFLS